MKRCIRALVVAVLVCLPSPASESPSDIVPPPFNLDSELLQVPSALQLPGGAVLPAGAYRVVIRQQLLKYVARPDASLGYWPGPPIELWPSERPMLSQLPLFYFALKTATEVKVVYDLPFKQPPDRLRVDLSGGAWTPLVRNGQLIGLMHRGQTLRVTDARRAAIGSRR
jgi:hypothetical protein